jgi:Plasmid pRiA4b ORF-3-like protein
VGRASSRKKAQRQVGPNPRQARVAPEEPVTFGELERLMLQLTGNSFEGLEQQMLARIKQETRVGGKRVARQELPGLPRDAVTTVHRVKVSLYGAKPPVWRRLEIPSAMPLNLVHAVLQIAFDWHGYHLHAFETVCGEFGSPDHDDDWAERQDEATATLAQVAGAERAKAVYSYDFGDDWRHDIVVEKIIPADPGVAYPRCTGGRRDAPPEDCGGIWVFNEQFADLGDLFNVGDLNKRLAGLATVVTPAS